MHEKKKIVPNMFSMHEIKNAKLKIFFDYNNIILGPQTLNMLSPPHWHNSQQSIPQPLHHPGEQLFMHPQDMSTLDDTLASGKGVSTCLDQAIPSTQELPACQD